MLQQKQEVWNVKIDLLEDQIVTLDENESTQEKCISLRKPTNILCWKSENQKETTFSKLKTTIIFLFIQSSQTHTGCSTNSISWGRSWLFSTPPFYFDIGEWLEQLGEGKLLPFLKVPYTLLSVYIICTNRQNRFCVYSNLFSQDLH